MYINFIKNIMLIYILYKKGSKKFKMSDKHSEDENINYLMEIYLFQCYSKLYIQKFRNLKKKFYYQIWNNEEK